MQNVLTEKLKEIAEFRQEKPGEVIAEAIEIGLEKMWVDKILGQYLKKRISRQKAAHLVGLDLVKLAEYQNKVVQNDLTWGEKTNLTHP